MHTTRSGYGAPEPESAAQALARVDTFITDHHARGDLVFKKRVEAARITEDLLAELHNEAVTLFAALEGHAVRITTTPSCVVDEDKNYVFAATPTSKRRLFRRRWHRTAIVELAEASGFTREGSGRLFS
ncbi:hypothetical protein QNA24_32215 [Rhodococcus qingshengii]|uniref:hypothetical protein n=1 Tax=Rhodococcus qingshengii TaxID=334542 RepID=UPI0024BA9911|nr:hypothetical protein [Rhodococcus qingshengii]MDJ0491050.1 hypothetical protein [Rhodococcus qingshengii]